MLIKNNSKLSTFQIDFQGLSQSNLPTGCEAVSTTAILQYYGIPITSEQFVDKYLSCDTFYRKGERLYGPNPHHFFVGNPYSSNSLGCYPEVILKALRKMKTKGHVGMAALSFQNTSGIELNDLIRNYIQNEIPVLLWITINMLKPYEGFQYFLEDETLYTWTAQEHCAVLCGYDEKNYFLMDPLKNGERIAYPKELVEQRYEELGKNSLVIYRK